MTAPLARTATLILTLSLFSAAAWADFADGPVAEWTKLRHRLRGAESPITLQYLREFILPAAHRNCTAGQQADCRTAAELTAALADLDREELDQQPANCKKNAEAALAKFQLEANRIAGKPVVVQIEVERLASGALGEYLAHAKTIRLDSQKSCLEPRLSYVVGHELGHAIDEARGNAYHNPGPRPFFTTSAAAFTLPEAQWQYRHGEIIAEAYSILLLERSGGTADQIAAAWTHAAKMSPEFLSKVVEKVAELRRSAANN